MSLPEPTSATRVWVFVWAILRLLMGKIFIWGFVIRGGRLIISDFFVYLRQKYKIFRAYLFIGYIEKNKSLYRTLERAGFQLIFKEVVIDRCGKVKGNVDAELVLQAMIDLDKYEQAVIVSSDGDFACLVRHLDQTNKLRIVLSTHAKTCSSLLKRAAKGKIEFMSSFQTKIGRK